jgi:hypothetical protein
MNKTVILSGTSMLLAALSFGQSPQRQATIRGGGNQQEGKCTIEVVVDGAAEVQVQGATATLRTTQGQPAQWRRFECSSAMPSNPVNFHFAGVDGRGRQQLIRDPRNGGVAVVQIEDRDNGSEGYTFDLTWSAANQGVFQQPGNQRPSGDQRQYNDKRDSGYQRQGGYRDYADDRYRQNYRDSEYYRRYGHGFAQEDAIQGCRDEVLRQSSRRFGGSEVHLRRTEIDDQPGRNDWVLGSLDVHRGPRGEQYNFACSVDFESGRVRSAQIDPQPIR